MFNFQTLVRNMEEVYRQLGCAVGSEESYSLFHSRFHIIPEITVNSLNW